MYDEVLHTDEAGNQLRRDSKGRVYAVNARGGVVDKSGLRTMLKKAGYGPTNYVQKGNKEFFGVRNESPSHSLWGGLGSSKKKNSFLGF